MDIRKINDHVSVAGQIEVADLAEIKAAGFEAIINNRPDGEAPDQPAGAEIEATARDLGLSYYNIPMGRDGVTPDMIADTRVALGNHSGPVLCYCRSGTRSTTLWALSRAGEDDADAIISAAANAGYDMSHLAGHLDKPVR